MIPPPALLAFFAVTEGATGLVLVAAPSVVAQLVFAASLYAGATIMGRLAGTALFSLAFACWIGREGAHSRALLAGMVAFNALAAAYLALLGIAGGSVGILLWQMVAVNAALTILTARAWASGQTNATRLKATDRLNDHVNPRRHDD